MNALLDLPHGFVMTIDEDDRPLVQGLTLYVGTNGYVTYSIWSQGRSTPHLLHRLFVCAPAGAHVDHINGDKLDNRRSNLRVVTPQRNQINRKRLNRNNTSGIRGVAYRPHVSSLRPWHAQITVQHRNIYLGMYATREDAVDARRRAELQYFGELCP